MSTHSSRGLYYIARHDRIIKDVKTDEKISKYNFAKAKMLDKKL